MNKIRIFAALCLSLIGALASAQSEEDLRRQAQNLCTQPVVTAIDQILVANNLGYREIEELRFFVTSYRPENVSASVTVNCNGSTDCETMSFSSEMEVKDGTCTAKETTLDAIDYKNDLGKAVMMGAWSDLRVEASSLLGNEAPIRYYELTELAKTKGLQIGDLHAPRCYWTKNAEDQFNIVLPKTSMVCSIAVMYPGDPNSDEEDEWSGEIYWIVETTPAGVRKLQSPLLKVILTAG